MARVFLSVGSNLGDRAALLRQAVERLRSLPEVEFVDASPVYWTEPWERRPGESSQNRETWFFNCVVAIETTLEPPSLLERMQALERAMGRTPPPGRLQDRRHGPRPPRRRPRGRGRAPRSACPLVRVGGWRAGRGRRRVPAAGPPAPRCALQPRRLSHPQRLGGRGPGPGDVCEGAPLLASLRAGNLHARLDVSDPEEHLLDLLPPPRARARAERGGRAGWRGPDVPPRPGRGRRNRRRPHGSRTGARAHSGRVPDAAPPRGGRGPLAGGGGTDHGLPGRHGEVAHLPGQGAAARPPHGLRWTELTR